VLTNVEHVALDLRVALRFVATTFDVLLSRDAWDNEAKKLTTLISEQAWCAAAMQPELKDDHTSQSMRSALARFATSVAPNAEGEWLALCRVEIAIWFGCAEEAELLDRMDTLVGEDKNDLVLISGFMSFTVYCHIVLFEASKKSGLDQSRITVVPDRVGVDDRPDDGGHGADVR
jgi:hypothetical protein